MASKISALASIIGLVLLSACNKAPPEPAPMAAASSAAPSTDLGRWLGRWQGPEGTFLDIARTEGAYRVTVQNLDGPRSFDASASTEGLSFVRDGVAETIRAGNGADTGMKWLADKKDCLVVKAGEGYCRS